MNSGKCKEEVLNRNEQAMKATRALNSLLWSNCILVNKFLYSDSKHFKVLVWEIWTRD